MRKEGNYWSNYDGADDGSGTGKHALAEDGIGDTNIPYPGAGGDYYPFMNRDGWLTMSLWPHYFDFERVYQGILINQTFTITNYANSILHVSSIKCDSPITISGIKLPADIPEGEKRCFNLTLDTEKEEGVVHKIIEVLSNDPQYPRKNITIFGFVEIPTSNIKIKRIDFPLRGFIKGQIGLLNITIENRGDFREKNVSIEIKEGDKTRDSTMIAIIDQEEAKSAIVKWNTNNVSLGIHDITIDVLNKNHNSLANITVTVTVLAPSQAKTLIVTNHERLEGIEDNLIRLSHHPSVNGIILDVGKDKRCSGAYNSFDS